MAEEEVSGEQVSSSRGMTRRGNVQAGAACSCWQVQAGQQR